MNKGVCVLCLNSDRRVFDIVNTHLQSTYEQLTADVKIAHDSHKLCYSCRQRLQQLYELSLLSKQTGGQFTSFHDNSSKVKQKKFCTSAQFPLVHLDNSLDMETKQEPNLKKGRLAGDDGTVNDAQENIEDSKSEKKVSTMTMRSQTENPFVISNQKTHTGDQTYCCDVCGGTFPNDVYLITHKRNHISEKPYSCDMCNNSFVRKCCLLSHYRTHMSEKSINCAICNRRFSNSGHIYTHRKTHG